MTYKKVVLQVHKVHKKKGGAFTASMLISKVNKDGMVMNKCVFAKFMEKPKAGKQFTYKKVRTEQSKDGYEWVTDTM
jgi:hypothetical protein